MCRLRSIFGVLYLQIGAERQPDFAGGDTGKCNIERTAYLTLKNC